MTDQPIIRTKRYIDPRTMCDFNADCGERLVAAGLPPTLHDAARCAGRQLEWLTPLIMGQRADGWPVAGLAARVARRNVLAVIADGERVAVQEIQPKPGVAIMDMVNEARANMTALFGGFHHEWIPEILGTALQGCGHPPAAEPPPGTNRLFNLIGALLAAPEVEGLASALDNMIAQDICPVLVGLLGPATSGRPDRFSAAWPVALALAPYRDALLDECAGS
jgi:hypothetical protein